MSRSRETTHDQRSAAFFSSCFSTLIGCAVALACVGLSAGSPSLPGDPLALASHGLLFAWFTVFAAVLALPAWLLVFQPLAIAQGVEGRFVRPAVLGLIGAATGLCAAGMYSWLFDLFSDNWRMPVIAGAAAGLVFRPIARGMLRHLDSAR